MFTVALFGAGKIGDAICGLLAPTGRYHIKVCDKDQSLVSATVGRWGKNCSAHSLNLDSTKDTLALLDGCDAVLSALPYYCNITVAQCAKTAKAHYLDLTEDVKTTKAVMELAKGAKTAFIPQCGLAPGFISVAANHLAGLFDSVESIKMRVGALPIFPSNQLKYNLTWSTEGLINEYGNLCEAIENGEAMSLLPLEGLETFSLDGVEYEAFNTSGGLGTLCESWGGRVKSLNYKTIRYPGHNDYVRLLMNELKFNTDRETLRSVLERSMPTTKQDKCIIFVEVRGQSAGKYTQRTYASTVYHQMVHGHHLGAIQITTASGICAPLDLLLSGNISKSEGFVRTESISLVQFLNNQYGTYYKDERALLGL